MGGHPEERTNRDDAGSTDTGNENAVGFVEIRVCRLGQRPPLVLTEIARLALLQCTAVHCHEARTETFDAGIILVAGRLIDFAFTAELGLDGNYRQAVRLLRAIPATLAHQIIDKDALGGVGKAPALAAPAFFGG